VLPASDSATVNSTSFPICPTNHGDNGFRSLYWQDIAADCGFQWYCRQPDGSGLAVPGDSMSLDIGNLGSMHLVSITPSPVPVPAAVWLFGSGLFGLTVVVAR